MNTHEDSIFEDPSSMVAGLNDPPALHNKSRSTWKHQKDSLIMISGTQVKHDSQVTLDNVAVANQQIKISVEPKKGLLSVSQVASSKHKLSKA